MIYERIFSEFSFERVIIGVVATHEASVPWGIYMTLATLENWENTRDALHQIALVVGAIRVACSDPLPNDLHFSVELSAAGISSARMRCGGELTFDFRSLQLAFERGGRVVFALDASGHSQVSLMRRLLALFDDCGYSIAPSMKYIAHESTFSIDPQLSIDYLRVLDAVYTALARFRARLSGYMSPLVLWPHHFDLAFIWFPTEDRDEHSAPQIAYGFSPFSPGLDRPYLYAYAWSKPTGYLQLPVEEPAQANSEGYVGLYAAYDDLRTSDDFSKTVESILLSYQRRAASELRRASRIGGMPP